MSVLKNCLSTNVQVTLANGQVVHGNVAVCHEDPQTGEFYLRVEGRLTRSPAPLVTPDEQKAAERATKRAQAFAVGTQAIAFAPGGAAQFPPAPGLVE